MWSQTKLQEKRIWVNMQGIVNLNTLNNRPFPFVWVLLFFIKNIFLSPTVHPGISFLLLPFSQQLHAFLLPLIQYSASSLHNRNRTPMDNNQILQNKIQQDRAKPSYRAWTMQPNKRKNPKNRQKCQRHTSSRFSEFHKDIQLEAKTYIQRIWNRSQQTDFLPH